jgi:hypothetical protein
MAAESDISPAYKLLRQAYEGSDEEKIIALGNKAPYIYVCLFVWSVQV